jgi:hypothetical protein
MSGDMMHMPQHYIDMKMLAMREFELQWREMGMTAPLPYKCRPYVFAWGRHNRAQDMVDNLPGTLYDALVEAGVVKNDSSMWCPGSVHDMVHSKAEPRIDILLAPWIPFSQSLEQFKEVIDWLKIV